MLQQHFRQQAVGYSSSPYDGDAGGESSSNGLRKNKKSKRSSHARNESGDYDNCRRRLHHSQLEDARRCFDPFVEVLRMAEVLYKKWVGALTRVFELRVVGKAAAAIVSS